MAAKLTEEDVEKIVMDAGNPERLLVDDDDWQEIYAVYSRYACDAEGVYIAVLETRIYRPRPLKRSLVNTQVIKDVIASKEA